MEYDHLRTASQIADELGEPPQRINYITRKHRVKPVHRIRIIRLFGPEQVEVIRTGLYHMQIRS